MVTMLTDYGDYGFLNEQLVSRVEFTIRRLEERLIEREEQHNQVYEREGWGDTSAARISSDQIRSIFSQLRSEG